MRRLISYFVLVTMFMAGTTAGFTQNAPTPSRDDAEKNAFQTPNAGSTNTKSGSSGEAAKTGSSQHSGSNPEAKNIDEPRGTPEKASPNGTAK